jgi:preprotein translocase subunit SecA
VTSSLPTSTTSPLAGNERILDTPRASAGSRFARRRIDRLALRLESRVSDLETLADEEVLASWTSLQERVRSSASPGPGSVADDDLVEALAVVSFFAPRVLGLSPYPVQRLGALILATGSLAEMRTGEGKTLSTAMAALALALSGRGVHVATANEYLAARDAAFLTPLANVLGVTVGVSRQGAPTDERISAHRCDVVYGTSTSFGFDYLYDNLAVFAKDVACREPFAALVDEADSVLLDEAVTPLLVSVTGTPLALDFARMSESVGRLVPDRDVYLDPNGSSVSLLDPGIDSLELMFADRLLGTPLYQHPRLVAQVQVALDARFIYVEGVDYIVADAGDGPSVVLIDANTGRRRSTSRLRSGLHEALEAKEGLQVRPGGVTRAMISVQNFFSRYPVLGGMTGTAFSARDEFMEFYGLEVFGVPTHRPSMRRDLSDRVFAVCSDRDAVLLEEVAALRALGRPVLIACESVADSARVGLLLRDLPEEGFPGVRVLSARDPEVEAEVLAVAGEPSQVTVATAMAGRGVDIVLGGVPGSKGFAERRAQVLASGGLAVVSTCRYPSRRVDDQLRGRAGRQGEPGSSLFLLSFDEDLPRRYAPDTVRGLLGSAGEMPARVASRVFEKAQAALSSEHVASRREVFRADAPLALDREAFYSFRRSLLGLDAWGRVVTVVRTAFAHRLEHAARTGSLSESCDVALFTGLWPEGLEFPEFSMALERTAVLDVLVETFLADLTLRLAPLEGLDPEIRVELLGRLAGSLVLDALDLVWAGHLESASGMYADARLTSRTGQDPERVYRSLLRNSFSGLFERFFKVAMFNLGTFKVTSASATSPAPTV